MTGSEHRRRKVLIDRKFQFGISLQIIGFVYFYLVLFALLANFDALRALVFGTSSDERYVEAVTRLQIFVQVFVVPLVFTFVCMCLHGVLFSHRLAGPIHRFKESLRQVRHGDLALKIRIRDKDYFGDLCEEMNSLLGQLREDMLALRKLSRTLAEEGEELARAGDLPPNAQGKLVSIANASTRLRQLMDGYRLSEGEEPATARSGEPVEPADARA